MADSLNSYSISDNVRQIQGKIGTSNALNGFIDNVSLSNYFNKKNKDEQNILKILSDILVSLAGSQDQFKKILVDILSNNLGVLEIEIKTLIKQYTLQLCSCGVNTKLNLPNGIVDQSHPFPEQSPYIDQYDFYGLFTKDINDPIQKLQFDNNFNTFVKENINSKNTTFTWKNKDNVDVVNLEYDEPNERIKLKEPTLSQWGPNGIGLKEFVDLYVDSINLFPPESILKSLLDSIFDMKEGDPYDIDLNFLTKFLFNKCNCKSIQDDRSKSTFDLNYYDFVPEKNNESDPTLMTDIKFGPVDAPIPTTIQPPQPKLDESYLNTVTVLSKEDFVKGNKKSKSDKIKNAIDSVAQSKQNQTTPINQPLNTKFSLNPGLESDMNLKMILMLPVILTMPLLSPKISMYFSVVYKRYYKNEPNKDLWTTKDEYYAFLEKFIELVIEDLLEYLLKKIFVIIKKKILELIKQIIIKVLSEKLSGYINQIQSILSILSFLKGKIPPQLPRINFKNCKSVLNNLSGLFDVPNIPPGTMLPTGMSLMGMAKTGLSPTLMTQDAVKNMNNYGMNIDPMPDGTPNPNVIIASSISKAVVNQLQSNARIQVSTVGVGLSEGGATIT